jgi:preprotein translocase subunit SecA
MFWIDHLNAMQELREGIGLRGYGQHDPLVEYKREAYNLFQQLQQAIDDEIVNVLMNAELVQTPPQEQQQRKLTYQGADEALAGGALSNIALAETSAPTGQHVQEDLQANFNSPLPKGEGQGEGHGNVEVSVRSASHKSSATNKDKVGRNDACPCGSGKKYKKCHGV